MIDRVVFTVHGDPAEGRINGRTVVRKGRGGRARVGNSEGYEAFKLTVADAARRASAVRRFRGGVLGIAITCYFARAIDPENTRRKKPLPDIPEGVAVADVDSPLKCILDGLELGGLIDDDVRFLDAHIRKRVDKTCPRAAIAVWMMPKIDG